jgi:hypothetical protein
MPGERIAAHPLLICEGTRRHAKMTNDERRTTNAIERPFVLRRSSPGADSVCEKYWV